MKATVLCCVLYLLLGCSHISVRVDPVTRVWTVNYWRLGSQEINGLEISKVGGDITVGLDSQKATDESLQEILKIVRNLSLDSAGIPWSRNLTE